MADRQVERNGKTYTQNTANIGVTCRQWASCYNTLLQTSLTPHHGHENAITH